jgi:uncharacterized protein (TIGR03000 family)
MKKFVSVAALGLVALFGTRPSPVSAASVGGIGRIGGIGGIGRIGGFGGIGRVGGIGRMGGFGLRGISVPSGGYGVPFRLLPGGFVGRTWREGYSYPTAGPSYSYPYAAYYPTAEASYYQPYSASYPQEQAVEINTVTMRLSVPAGAKVWFDGAATAQTGADREFESPPLTPGREYTYHVRVQWHHNGKAVERTRAVTVHAGDRINLTIDK